MLLINLQSFVLRHHKFVYDDDDYDDDIKVAVK